MTCTTCHRESSLPATVWQEGCFGRKDTKSSAQGRRPKTPNILVLGDIRRLLSQTAAAGGDTGGGLQGAGGEAGAWNIRAPNVIAAHIDTPQEVRNGGRGVFVSVAPGSSSSSWAEL